MPRWFLADGIQKVTLVVLAAAASIVLGIAPGFLEWIFCNLFC
jgi:hypothetical protein